MALFNELFNLTVTSFISASINDAAKQIEEKNSTLVANTIRSYCNTSSTGKTPGASFHDLIETILDIAELNIRKYNIDATAFYTLATEILKNNFISPEIISNLIDKTQPVEKNIEVLLTYSIASSHTNHAPIEYFDKSLLTQAPYFIGRTQVTQLIVEQILENKQSFYLLGIGGIGKSEIIKAVISNIVNFTSTTGISSIIWINLNNGDPSSLKYDIVTNYLKRKDISDINGVFNKVIQNLRKLNNTLLIVIDNIEVITDDLNNLISLLPKAVFLLAGRVDNFSLNSNIKKIIIESLTSNDCFELFCHYYYKTSSAISTASDIEKDAITKIITLADYHTVTIELLAKLACKQEQNLLSFLNTLIKYGFHFKFLTPEGNLENEEKVKTHHELMRDKERYLIEQLKILFKIFGLTTEEEKLLIQISAIPNMQFAFSKAKKWFSLSNRSALISLCEKGWLLKNTDSNLLNTYWIHSIIASAVRAQYTEKLHSICQPFISELTNELIDSLPKNDKVKKNLIQFCWAINDIFSNEFSSVTDCNFLYVLAKIYEEIGFYNRAINLYEIVLRISESSDNGFYGRNLAQIINIYASLKLQVGDYDGAIAYYEILLKSWHAKNKIKTATEDSLTVYGVLKSNLGHAFLLKLRTIKTSSEYSNLRKQAIQNINEGYKILSKTSDAYNVAVSLLYKAYIYLWDYDYSNAEKYYSEALTKSASLPVTKMNQTLIITIKKELGALFALAWDSGTENQISLTYEQTKTILQEALSACKKYYSSENIRTLDIYNTIYSIDLIFGTNYELLSKRFSKLLLCYENIYNSDSINGNAIIENIANIYSNLGACHHNIGINFLNANKQTEALQELNKALTMYQNALDNDRQINGDTSLSLSTDYNNVGSIYFAISKISNKESNLNSALYFFNKALEINMLHRNYYEVAYTLYHIADCYLALNNTDETINIANSIEELYIQSNIEYTMTIKAEIYWLYARCHKTMGDIEKAKQYGEKIKLLYEQSGFTPRSPEIREINSFIKGCM